MWLHPLLCFVWLRQFQIRPVTDAGSGSPSNAFMLNHDGNIGLGTSTYATKLNVAGGGLFKGNVTVEGSNGAILGLNVYRKE